MIWRTGFMILSLCLVVAIFSGEALAADSWGELQRLFQPENQQPDTVVFAPVPPPSQTEDSPKIDPWAQLQTIFIPFTVEEEAVAQVDPQVRKKVAATLNAALSPYRTLIVAASTRFSVPVEVIAAVIMVESGGNPHAAASTSSAKGLMQTIAATFSAARHALQEQGLTIKNDPFDPQASIMAGTWYLDQMFRQVIHDRGPVLKRNSITSWRLPTEYYYAGPGHGRKRSQVVMIYAGGKQIRVDKSGYSNKVLAWARIMGGQQAG